MTMSQFSDIEQCGRTFTNQEIEEIAETVKAFPNLSQTTLTETLCEHLSWFTATRRYKKDACLKLLRKIEAAGVVKLPPRRTRPKPHVAKAKIAFAETLPTHQPVHCKLKAVRPVSVEPVTNRNEVELWNQYVGQYHYLGYKRPFGCFITQVYHLTSSLIL